MGYKKGWEHWSKRSAAASLLDSLLQIPSQINLPTQARMVILKHSLTMSIARQLLLTPYGLQDKDISEKGVSGFA